jgi:hypothetical protein
MIVIFSLDTCVCIVRYVPTLVIQAVSYERLTTDMRMRPKDSPYEIYGEKIGMRLGSHCEFRVYPIINHHFFNIPYLFIFHPRDENWAN